MRPRWLIVGVGNPSRGDDALGPMLIEALEDAVAKTPLPVDLTLLTDFQLQIEHALDLRGQDVVVFVDASVALRAGFELRRAAPALGRSPLTHALSPAAVLAVAARLGDALPEAYLMAVAGEAFDLGEPLSDAARTALTEATAYLMGALQSGELGPTRALSLA